MSENERETNNKRLLGYLSVLSNLTSDSDGNLLYNGIKVLRDGDIQIPQEPQEPQDPGEVPGETPGHDDNNSVSQVYIGPDEPIDPNILLWIDTSEPEETDIQLLTSDGEEFIDANGREFVLMEE